MTEPTRLLRRATLRVPLAENVADLVGVSLTVRPVVRVNTDLIVIVIILLITLVQLIGYRDMLCHAWEHAHRLVEKNARC